MLRHALAYAAKGWAVFPLVPGGKEPLTEHGFKDATTDSETIVAWWTRWPSANIGRWLGYNAYGSGDEASTLVIDIDPRNGGVVPEELPLTLTCLTGGGGYHYYYSYLPNNVGGQGFRKVLQDGVDIKASRGYVVLPPSVTESVYQWDVEEVPLTPCPDWLLKACQKPSDANLTPEMGSVVDDPTDTRPGTLFNRTARIEDILEPHGWTRVYTQGVESFWRRPGKSEGISATYNYNGSKLFHVFTSSTELEPDQAYSLFGLYAALEYGGDYREAALSLETTRLTASANLVQPEEYSFEHAYPAGHFVTAYIEYASKQTDAPTEYHESAALSLLALATSHCKAELAPYPTGLSSNLYVSLVGTTTRSRKSTAQKIAGDIAKAVSPGSILPNRATPEALIKALAGKSGIPTIWMPDEFGVSLAEIYNRDYLKSLEELLLTLYAGEDYTYERSMDVLRIREPHLSILAAGTPESIGRAGATAAESGLLPRFAVVYPKVLPTPRVVTTTPEGLAVERASLISRLQQIMQWANTHKEITFDQEALSILNEAELRLVNSSGGQRLPTMLYKVALLGLAGAVVGRGGASIHPSSECRVGRVSALSAVSVVERWRQGMERLIPLLYKGGADPAFEKQLELAMVTLNEHGGTAARPEVARALTTTKGKLDVIEQTLMDRGMITLIPGEGKVWRVLAP